MKPTYLQYAKSRWKSAEWIKGGGRWALLAHCGYLSVSLQSSRELAEEMKCRIDATGCGGQCCRDHEIVDLGPFARPPKTGRFAVKESPRVDMRKVFRIAFGRP